MKKFISYFLFISLFYICHINTFGSTMENGISVSYTVVDAKELEASFFKNDSGVKLLPNDLYVMGYIRQDIPVKHDVSCSLYFYNSGQRGLKRIAKIGWIGTGKFFLLQLGSKDIYSKNLQYEIKIDMRK